MLKIDKWHNINIHELAGSTVTFKSWMNKGFLLNAWIFLDAHECPISVAFDALENFTLHSCSFHFVIPLTSELSTVETKKSQELQ